MMSQNEQEKSQKNAKSNLKLRDDLEHELFLLEKLKHEKVKTLKREIKALKKSENKTLEHIKKCLDWKKKEHEANLLKAHFKLLKKGMETITVLDWMQNEKKVVLTIDPKKSPQDLLKSAFKEVKKLKLGIEYQKKQLISTQNKLIEKEKLLSFIHSLIDEIKTVKDFFFYFPKKKEDDKKLPPKLKKALPYRQYVSKAGFNILVGKNNKSNDALTFQYAKGNDLWLHVKDYPGSHVIIQKKKKDKVDQETIEEAAQLAVFYSKANLLNKVEISLTEQKYISRFGKKKDGKVQISKQKSFFVTKDPIKIEQIKKTLLKL